MHALRVLNTDTAVARTVDCFSLNTPRGAFRSHATRMTRKEPRMTHYPNCRCKNIRVPLLTAPSPASPPVTSSLFLDVTIPGDYTCFSCGADFYSGSTASRAFASFCPLHSLFRPYKRRVAKDNAGQLNCAGNLTAGRRLCPLATATTL